MDNAQKLRALFTGLQRAYGTYTLAPVAPNGSGALVTTDRNDKREGRARTVRAAVGDDLYAMHLAGEQGLGIVPVDDDGVARFGAIDIDVYDLDLVRLEAAVQTLELPLLPTRTKSGGAHLYCFTHGVPAAALRKRMQEWSSALGFPNAEIFPKQSRLANKEDTGNWINLPYFAWDIDENVRYGVYEGKPMTFEAYCARAEELRINEVQLRALVMDAKGAFDEGPPCLQAMARTGFPVGVRNNSLFAIGVYLRKRYVDDWKAKLRIYNDEHIKPPLDDREVLAISKSLERKKYNYKCTEAPCRDHCNKAACRTRKYGVHDAVAGKDEWGVMIDSDAQKVLTDPPYFLVNVNGTRIKLFAEELLYQKRFQQACIDRISYLPPMLDAETWRNVVNEIITNAEPIEAAQDSGAAGEAVYHLRQFTTVRQAESREEIMKGMPYTENGETFFRSADFKKYLESQHYRALNGARLYATLKELAGMHYRTISIGEKSVHVWVVPAHPANVIQMPPRQPRDPGM